MDIFLAIVICVVLFITFSICGWCCKRNNQGTVYEVPGAPVTVTSTTTYGISNPPYPIDMPMPQPAGFNNLATQPPYPTGVAHPPYPTAQMTGYPPVSMPYPTGPGGYPPGMPYPSSGGIAGQQLHGSNMGPAMGPNIGLSSQHSQLPPSYASDGMIAGQQFHGPNMGPTMGPSIVSQHNQLPPSYADAVTQPHTNEVYAKQSPYNPNY